MVLEQKGILTQAEVLDQIKRLRDKSGEPPPETPTSAEVSPDACRMLIAWVD